MNLANISHQKKIKQKKRCLKEKIRFFENDFFQKRLLFDPSTLTCNSFVNKFTVWMDSFLIIYLLFYFYYHFAI